jgi:hypothetical protein
VILGIIAAAHGGDRVSANMEPAPQALGAAELAFYRGADGRESYLCEILVI